MTEERWIVTHATESGATRMWWVSENVAKGLLEHIHGSLSNGTHGRRVAIAIDTIAGAALIWLTPGQSLTVEKSNG